MVQSANLAALKLATTKDVTNISKEDEYVSSMALPSKFAARKDAPIRLNKEESVEGMDLRGKLVAMADITIM